MNVLKQAYESVKTHPVVWTLGAAALAGSAYCAVEAVQWVNEVFVQGNGFAPDVASFDPSVING